MALHPSHTLGPVEQRDPRFAAPQRRACTQCGATQDTGPGIIVTSGYLEEECRRTLVKPKAEQLDPISVFWSPEGWGAPSRLVKVRPGSGYAVETGTYDTKGK